MLCIAKLAAMPVMAVVSSFVEELPSPPGLHARQVSKFVLVRIPSHHTESHCDYKGQESR